MPNTQETGPAEEQKGNNAEGRAKKAFIRGFESLILSGKFKPGDKIPAERELSKDYRLSRPVIHEGLLELAGKGFVTISPRRGTFVSDFRRMGSMDSLAALFAYTEGKLTRRMYESLLEFRLHFELEAVRKAVQRRGAADIEYLESLLQEENELLESVADTESPLHPESAADLDFRFHLAIILASGNEVYPMFFNSFRKFNIAILRKHYEDRSLIAPGFAHHAHLVRALRERDESAAAAIMREILMASPAPIELLA
jgi:GntR family transcriptional repressor for pyruvate dehydrogenase complex